MRALLLVDLQNDFCPGGALAVANGEQVVSVANSITKCFELVVATQDWHPAHHGSFAANHEGRSPGEFIKLDGLEQILWPVHCVQDTPGAEFVQELDQTRIGKVFTKGTDPTVDSYSGFFDNGRRKATGLLDYLKTKQVDEVFVMGLATDYCVKFTALDSASLGLKTSLIADGCRAVNLKPGDDELSLAEMGAAGIAIVSSAEVM
jgi:nicotinamidase/pyrazinamidase